MVQMAEPDRVHDLASVEEATFDQLRPLLEETFRRDRWISPSER